MHAVTWASQQCCLQQVVLNNMQKTPRRKLKIEFVCVGNLHQAEVQRSWLQLRQAQVPRGKFFVWTRSSKYKTSSFKLAFYYGWIILKSWAGFSWVFNVRSIYWFQLVLVHACPFRSVGAAAVLRRLHVIAEHNNLTACLGSSHCSYPTCYLLPYPYSVMPLGQDYLFALCAATQVIKILTAPSASRNYRKKAPFHNYLLIWYASMWDISLALIGFGSVSLVPLAFFSSIIHEGTCLIQS